MNPNPKSPTISIKDIARMAGVSKTTVSFIINGKAKEHQISTETIQKVQSIVEQMQFVPNEFARGFRLKQTKTIGLVVGDVYNHFLSLLEKTIEIEARNQGFNLVIASSDDDPELESRAIQSFLSRSVDALILVSVYSDNKIHQQLNTRNIPIIYLDRVVTGRHVTCVTTDNYAGAFKLTEQFASQSCRHIAFIGGRPSISTSSERFRGFQAALEHYHLPYSPDLIVHGEFTVEAGYLATKQLFSAAHIYPDAIFTASYTLLEGLFQYAREFNLNILQRIKLATFDDHPLFDFLPFKVNSVQQNTELMGKTAFDLVLQAIRGNRNLENVVIPPKFIIRQS